MPAFPSSPAVPRRVAVIDLGTNSTRLLVADVQDGKVTEVERRTRVTRLGRGVDYSRQLSAEAIEDVCAAVREYVDRLNQLGAEVTSVIATSAVRDAENGSAFVAELRERFELNAKVIDGIEEARLTYLGCVSERSGDETLLVIDIGGGSTEMVVGRGDRPGFHASLQAGVVRHTERLLGNDPPTASELEELSSDIHKLLHESIDGQQLPTIDAAVAVAGTPSSLAAVDLELDPYDADLVEGHVLQIKTIQWWLSRLSSVPLADRKLIVGLHPDRARAIVAGVVILIEIMRAFELESVECSEHDILYGGAIEAAAGLGQPRLRG